MLRNLLSNRIFIGILVLLVCGVVSVYFLRTDLPEEPIKIYTPVEPLPKPKAEAPIGETEQDGHVHEDGTWHEGAHDAPVESPVEAPVTTPPEPDPLETFSEEERQAAITRMLESLPEKLELMRKNRDTLKRTYERLLGTLKHFEEMNAQHGRNFWDTSRVKEDIAEAKAQLDREESNIYHLEKWRDEHTNK